MTKKNKKKIQVNGVLYKKKKINVTEAPKNLNLHVLYFQYSLYTSINNYFDFTVNVDMVDIGKKYKSICPPTIMKYNCFNKHVLFLHRATYLIVTINTRILYFIQSLTQIRIGRCVNDYHSSQHQPTYYELYC